MNSPSDCIFCKIIAGEIPAATVLEEDAVVAFLDVNPVTPGHLLLVPTSHDTNLFDASNEVVAQMGTVLPRLARALRNATGAPALNVVINAGGEAGQVVDHLHFHLIPRRADDAFQMHWPKTSYAEGEQEALRQRITAALKAS